MTHSKKFLVDYYTKFLNKIITNSLEDDEDKCAYSFIEFLQTRNPNSFCEWQYSASISRSEFCNCASGLTKGVIWDNVLPYVLKTPFGDEFEVDHCRAEARNYKRALEEGLESCFAWCEKLMDFEYKGNLVPIYIMSYAECGDEMITDSVYSYLSEIGATEEEISSINLSDSYIVEEFLEHLWGEEYFSRFISFCFDNKIDDLHSGNVGYIGNEVVCVDYSGFSAINYDVLPDNWWD